MIPLGLALQGVALRSLLIYAGKGLAELHEAFPCVFSLYTVNVSGSIAEIHGICYNK